MGYYSVHTPTLRDGASFPDAVLSVARRELARGCKEQVSRSQSVQNNNPCGNDYNGYVWPLWAATRSTYNPQTGVPYCASFVCYVLAGAASVAGCMVQMIVTGSVQGMGVWAEAQGVLKDHTYTPQPGDIFLRNRWLDGTRTPAGTTWYGNGMGHCGIVTGVTATGGIQTIEANGIYSANGGVDAVHTQEYTPSEVHGSAYGFYFIPASAVATCPQPNEQEQPRENNNGSSSNSDSSNTSTRRAQRDGGGDDVMDISNTLTRRPQRSKDCPPASLTLVDGDIALHYTALLGADVASDVFGANNSEIVSDSNWSRRNGAAMGYGKSEIAIGNGDPMAFTGFGIFTDRAGNTIVITTEEAGSNTNSKRLIEKLLPLDIVTKVGVRYIGNPKSLTYAETVMGRRKAYWAQSDEYREYVNNHDSNDLRKLTVGGVRIFDQLFDDADTVRPGGGSLVSFKAVPLMRTDGTGLLANIEKVCLERGRLDTILWIHYEGAPPESNWWDILSTVLNVVSAFAPLPGIGIAKNIFVGASSAIKGIKSGNLVGSIQGIAAVTGAIAPDFLRNAELSIRGAISDIESELKLEWQSGYEKIITPVVRAGGSILAGIDNNLTLQSTAKKLGIDWKELDTLKRRFTTFAQDKSYTPDFVNKIAGKYVDYAPVIQTLNSSVLVNSLRTQLRSVGKAGDENISWLRTQVLDVYEGKAYDVPLLQELFSTGLAGALIPTVPGFSDIVASILTDGLARVETLGDHLTDPNFAHKIKNWIGGAFGYQMGKNILGDLTVQSLVSQAQQYAKNAIKDFPLPLSIPEHLRESIAREVSQAAGDVRVHCSDGYVYDVAQCRCVKAGGSTTSEPPRKEFPNTDPDPNVPPGQGGDDVPPSSRGNCCPNNQSVVVNNYLITDKKSEEATSKTTTTTGKKSCAPGTIWNGVDCIPMFSGSNYDKFCATCQPVAPVSAGSTLPATIKLEMPKELFELLKPQQPVFNITLPKIELPAPIERPTSATSDPIKVDVHVPQQPAPVINMPAPVVNVAVPQQAAPVVNMPAPVINVPAPVVNVAVPQQAAPVVNFQIPQQAAPVVHVAAPNVNVQPRVEVRPNIQIPQQAAPVVNVAAPNVNVQPNIYVPRQAAPVVHVAAPNVNVRPDVHVNVPQQAAPMVNNTITLPKPEMPIMRFSPVIYMPQQLPPTVNMPAPVVNVQPRVEVRPNVQVHVPRQAAPVVNIEPARVNATITMPKPEMPIMRFSPVINIPRQGAPVVNVAAPNVNVQPRVEVRPDVHVNVPQQAAPVVHVQPNIYVPRQGAPVVNVAPARVNATVVMPKPEMPMMRFSPVVNVNVPRQSPPVVNVPRQAAPVVNVAAPVVNMPQQLPPTINSTIVMPKPEMPMMRFSPVINVPRQGAPVVHVQPARVGVQVNTPKQELPAIQFSPVINVPERTVNIQAPNVRVPVNVNVPVTVPERSVTVQPAVVNVAPARVRVPVNVNIPERTVNVQAPNINIAPAQNHINMAPTNVRVPVNVNVPERTNNVYIQNRMPASNPTYYNVFRPTVRQANNQTNVQSQAARTTQQAHPAMMQSQQQRPIERQRNNHGYYVQEDQSAPATQQYVPKQTRATPVTDCDGDEIEFTLTGFR